MFARGGGRVLRALAVKAASPWMRGAGTRLMHGQIGRQEGDVEAGEETRADVVVVGSGIVGASAAYRLAEAGLEVCVLEGESHHGYHSTGRSAALYAETYGSFLVRALTTGSKGTFFAPEEALVEAGAVDGSCAPFVSDRGLLWIARSDQMDAFDGMYRVLKSDGLVDDAQLITVDECIERCPALSRTYLEDGGAMFSQDARDIDVNHLHMTFLRAAAVRGARIATGTPVTALRRDHTHEEWVVTHSEGATVRAPLVVNAAGAWGDHVAEMAGVPAVGLQPKRRTIATIDLPDGSTREPASDARRWPMVFDVDEELYFKPDAGQMLVSPCDQTPVDAHDAFPEDLDIAIAMDRLSQATDIEVTRINHSWAGLRTFAPDHEFVIGEESGPAAKGFVWAVGMGGYGIQTSPAVGRLIAASVTGAPVPSDLHDLGVTFEALSPDRLRTSHAH